MMGIFDKHKVAFVSVTQAFNTASSMGRLVLNVLLSFAQFEREIIGERIRDKIAATRRKGKWAGGPPALGFDVKTSPLRLEVNPEEAERVRAIFDLYLQQGALRPVVEELERRKWRTKKWSTRSGEPRGDRPFTKNSLQIFLRNVLYSGKLRYKDEVHPGEHAAIVTPEVWQAVQDRLAESRPYDAPRFRTNCLLSGLLRCTPCGRSMAPTFSNRGPKRYRYYTCTGAIEKGYDRCPSKGLPAAQVEKFVLDQLPARGENSAVPPLAHVRALVHRIEYDGATGAMSIQLRNQEPQ
jgi:site-specific DNA recombinase